MLHGAHNAGDFNKLTVLNAAGELLVRHRLGARQGRGAEQADVVGDDDGGVFAGFGGAFDFDDLAGNQVRGRHAEPER